MFFLVYFQVWGVYDIYIYIYADNMLFDATWYILRVEPSLTYE